MLLEDQGRPGRHADFDSGVQCICDPLTCRHTAHANDVFRTLEDICTNLISEGEKVEACKAMSVFERMLPYYKHITQGRLERARSISHDKWVNDRALGSWTTPTSNVM
jgi:hypothetical protein